MQEKDYSVIDIGQIPEIHLYMDQLITFMEEKLKSHKREENERLITKTMINNYTQGRILPPPERKKYSPEQIMLIIMILNLKPSLSISDIGRLLNSDILKNTGVGSVYELFTKMQKKEAEYLQSALNQMERDIDEILEPQSQAEGIQKLLLGLFLAIDATAKKLKAERLINEYFSKPLPQKPAPPPQKPAPQKAAPRKPVQKPAKRPSSKPKTKSSKGP